MISSNGKWKLHLPHNYRYPLREGIDGQAGIYIQNSIDTVLFDMVHDPYEKVNVITEFPGIAEQLSLHAGEHNRKFFR